MAEPAIVDVSIVVKDSKATQVELLLHPSPQHTSISVRSLDGTPLLHERRNDRKWSWDLSLQPTLRIVWPAHVQVRITLELSDSRTQNIIVKPAPEIAQQAHWPAPRLVCIQHQVNSAAVSSTRVTSTRLTVTGLHLQTWEGYVHCVLLKLESSTVKDLVRLDMGHGKIELEDVVLPGANIRTIDATIDAKEVSVWRETGSLDLSTFSGHIIVRKCASRWYRLRTGQQLLPDADETVIGPPPHWPADEHSHVVLEEIRMPPRSSRQIGYDEFEAHVGLLTARARITIHTNKGNVTLASGIMADHIRITSKEGSLQGMPHWPALDGQHEETQHIKVLEIVSPGGKVLPSSFGVETGATFDVSRPLNVDLDVAISEQAPAFLLKVDHRSARHGRSAGSFVRIWRGHIFHRAITYLQPWPNDVSVEVEPADQVEVKTESN